MTDGACDPSAFITLALTKCHASFRSDLSDRPVYKRTELDTGGKKMVCMIAFLAGRVKIERRCGTTTFFYFVVDVIISLA